MSISENIGINVKYLAKEKGLALGEVEKELGVSTGYFSRKVDGSNIPVQLAFNAAKLFGVSMDEFCSDIRFENLKKEAAELGYKLVRIEGDNE